jgi:hypothetical protein
MNINGSSLGGIAGDAPDYGIGSCEWRSNEPMAAAFPCRAFLAAAETLGSPSSSSAAANGGDLVDDPCSFLGISMNARSGPLLPPNIDSSFPCPGLDNGVIPHFYLTQFLSEHLAIVAGKLDVTGGI